MFYDALTKDHLNALTFIEKRFDNVSFTRDSTIKIYDSLVCKSRCIFLRVDEQYVYFFTISILCKLDDV